MTARTMRSNRKWMRSALGALVSLGLWAAPGVGAADKTPEVDAKTQKELQAAEARFGDAIEKRDTAALSEMLADYYADSIGDEKEAVPKRRVIARAKGGSLVFYRIERDALFTVSAQTYTIEGEAKSFERLVTDEPAKFKWVKVRRMWIKKDGRWLLILQNIRDVEEEKSETSKK
jgi:hypothetical protein